MTQTIDWRRATRRAGALARPGPTGSPSELRGVVRVLRGAAVEAPRHVAEITGLHEAAEQAAAGPVYVVDRARWAEANVAMMASLLEGELPQTGRVGAGLAGEELGVVLAALSSRVLGQFDPFTPAPATSAPVVSTQDDDGDAPDPGPADADTGTAGRGRLLLVAPNILKLERELDLDAMDFRLWVCLHEQTHAVQFAAAPWLAGHLRSRMRGLTEGLTDTEHGEQRVTRLLSGLTEVIRGRRESDAQPLAGSLMEVVLTEAERADLAETVAVMSLLEGHADVVMDAIDPRLLPSVRHIRRSFERRRDGRGPADVILRRLLGMDAKVAQYRHGAAFVREVIEAVGHEGLGAVWSSAEQLPSAEEIADPSRWVHRVHG